MVKSPSSGVFGGFSVFGRGWGGWAVRLRVAVVFDVFFVCWDGFLSILRAQARVFGCLGDAAAALWRGSSTGRRGDGDGERQAAFGMAKKTTGWVGEKLM